MWFFSQKKEVESQLAKQNHSLSTSFYHVRQDTNRVFQWMQYFQQKSEAHDRQLQLQNQQIQELFNRFSLLPGSREELKNMVDNHYSNSDSSAKIEELRAKIDQLVALQGPAMEQVQALRTRIDNVENNQKPRAHFKERIVQKIQKNSKEYVKNLILSYVRKYEKISALKLREMVVEEQGLSSKSSFYRILDEIESLDEVDMVQEGKQKFYFSTISRSIRN